MNLLLDTNILILLAKDVRRRLFNSIINLWIAATAALLGLKLITTDQDFNHLHRVFIEVECLTPESFRQ